jgi:hypothetical protein
MDRFDTVTFHCRMTFEVANTQVNFRLDLKSALVCQYSFSIFGLAASP